MSRIFITGATQGIGLETARTLIEQGHEVVLHARNESRALSLEAGAPGSHAVVTGELSNIAETKALAAAANGHGPYDVIIHNAGIGGGGDGRRESADGVELVFHTNVIAPYMLTALMPVAPRMIYLTSGLEADGRCDFDDLQWSAREWHGMQCYSDSKLYDSMLGAEVAARHPESIVNWVDPGWIQTSLGGPQAPDHVSLGAETQVWLATSDDAIATTSGQYVKRREVHAPNPAVHDVAARARLIEALQEMTGLSLP